MANRVRFLSLTLAGFGRYERATRFELAGRSCSFTSPNELGKSTFQAGLLAVLFGPPPVRAKAMSFQSRYRSWSGGLPFWGELDLSVNDEVWRVHQDFDSLCTQVWRVPSQGALELRFESKPKSPRQAIEIDAYGRLVEDWLGFRDRELYEAMFTVSQQSTLSTSWQIDARVASRIYGPAIERIERSLQELFDRFREISRHTREHQISVGTQGERNGRSDGRLDQVVAQSIELEARLEAARGVVADLAQQRQRLGELDDQVARCRGELDAIARSLASWRAWVDMESRLQPAVNSYERLSRLHERCQQITRPMAELRGRMSGELGIFHSVPDDFAERLEYMPLLGQAAEDGRRHRAAMAERIEGLQAELAALEEELAREFSPFRGRSELPDQVEELQLVQAEIESVQARLAAWSQSGESTDERREAIERQIERLTGWRCFSSDPAGELEPRRRWVEQFAREHGEFIATMAAVHSEREWLVGQCERIERLKAANRSQSDDRGRVRAELAGATAAAERLALETRDRKLATERARVELERRYVDFRGAPEQLPALWDAWHALQAEESAARHRVAAIQDELHHVESRVRWRRGLTVFGVLVAVACGVLSPTWGSLWVAAAAAGLCLSLRWIYSVGRDVPGWIQERAGEAATQIAQLGRSRDQLVRQIGAAFIVPAEREAEWRRLWPAYQRERARIEAEQSAAPDDRALERLELESKQARAALDRFDAETVELLEEGRRAVAHAEAELERRRQALSHLDDTAATHLDRYFSGIADWPDIPVDQLGDSWRPIVEIARADLGDVRRAGRLVDWCVSLDDRSWRDFAERCHELRRLEELIAPDPEARAARDAAIVQARELLQVLEPQRAALEAAIEPFTAQTDIEWLRLQCEACAALESRVAGARHALQELRGVLESDTASQRAEAEYAAAVESLGPYLTRFDGSSDKVAAAWSERVEVQRQLLELESQAAELLAESGYSSLEQLAHEAGKAEGLVGTIRGESHELLAEAAELWSAVDAPPGLAAQRAGELEVQYGDRQAALEALERERAELAAAIRHAESDPANDLATIANQLRALESERAELERRRGELAAEFQESNRLMQELKRVERTALEGRITAFFADFSRTAGRRVRLDDELHMVIENEDGTRYAPDQLSHGARDQLYLAVYLATTAGFDLPFVLDDPFVNCDHERLAAIRACWDRLAPDRQLVLLSHDPQMAAWSPALEIRDAA